MSETAHPIPQPASRWRILTQNPVMVKELRSRMRGRRAFVVLTIYLLAMSGLISLVYAAYASAAATPYGPDPSEAGKVVFAVVMGVQGFLVLFIGPAFTAGAITGEKERQTYELLQTTLLSPRWFVLGKLMSALSYILLLTIASIPLQSIAFLLGGLSFTELVVGQLLLAVTAVAFALYGLYCSSIMRTTLASSVATFGGTLFAVVGFPLLILLIFWAFSATFLWYELTDFWEYVAAYGGMGLVATNLPATVFASALILLEEGSLFFFDTFVAGRTVRLFSPRWVYTLLYSLIATLLYVLCVRRVQRVSDK
jgi:ABC-2 type transport system permease protein